MRPTLYLLPGWSFDAAVYAPLRRHLAAEYTCCCGELPGHAGAAEPRAATLDQLLAGVVAQAPPPPVVWVGWSLGATLALEALARSGKITAAVVIAGTPCFAHAPDWPHGVKGDELAAMRSALVRRPEATVRQFRRRLAAVSAADAQAVAGASRASPAGLAAGLALLANADLRPRLAEIAASRTPTLWIGGGRDPLIAPAAIRAAAAQAAGAFTLIEGAGHLPHVTHSAAVASALRSFLGGGDW